MSAAGVLLYGTVEGRVNRAYPDPATRGDPWTICDGHTGPDVYKGLTLTNAQCDALTAKDIKEHKARLALCIRMPVTQTEADALTSWAMNVGTDRACKSTLVRLLNQGDYVGAANEFPKWKLAAGRPLPGLPRRRRCERELFLTDPTGWTEAASLAAVRACLRA